MRLLIHSCCAPCSSSVLERLINENQFNQISVYYFNPNICPNEEYLKRKSEQIRLLNEVYPQVQIIESEYNPNEFFNAVKGYENCEEGGLRCSICYELRMRATAIKAKELGYEFFATTLSVSPYKNALHLNQIGLKLQDEYDVQYLVSDFKKKNGYLRSIQLSKQYNLYRQDYCGCPYSLNKNTKNSK